MTKRAKNPGRGGGRGGALKMVVVLFVITAVSAFLLAFVNDKTEGIIDARTQEKLSLSMQEVMPDADSFEPAEDYAPAEPVQSVYLARSDGKLIGYCVVSVPSGFGGGITLMVGVDTHNEVTKVRIIDMNETPSLGTKAQDERFLEQYAGMVAGITVNGTDENSIDGITGATITSKAVTAGVNAAIDAVWELQTGEKPDEDEADRTSTSSTNSKESDSAVRAAAAPKGGIKA